jgi:hypothetical protein
MSVETETKDVPKQEEDAEMEDTENEVKPKTKKYTDWPLKNIKEPHDHDVLYGRGGGTNHHPGNKRYRKMVEERKMDYVNSKRLDKPLVALDIIKQWREQDPPGRFLKIDDRTGLWNDVGDKKAREKTSQALREKAPQLRKQQEEEEQNGGSDEDVRESPVSKTTRFAEGTHKQKDEPKKPMLARDHSLGRELLEVGENVTLEGFSWQDPLQEMYPGRVNSQGSYGRVGSHGSIPPEGYYPPGRMNSQGSMGVPHPNYHQSHGSYPTHYRTMSEDRHSQYTSSGRYESWGQPISSMGSNGPPMPPPPPPVPGYGGPYMHQRSGSWGPTSSWGPPPVGRDHSLSYNPLRDANTTQAAMPSAFESGRSGSGGYWPEAPPPPVPQRGGGPPPPQQFQPPARTSSGSGTAHASPPRAPPSQYNVDPSIAQTWSSQSDDYERVSGIMSHEVQRSWSGEEYGRTTSRGSSPSKQQRRRDGPNQDTLSRPNIVKRATSNQNETIETKPDLRGPSVKRAALNRDNSLVSNRLKAEYMNGTLQETATFDSEKEVRNLSGNLEQTTLHAETVASTTKTYEPRQKRLTASERTSTIDKIAMELMTQPDPLRSGSRSRSSTFEALALDFDDDQLPKLDLDRMSSLGSVFSSNVPRPGALTSDGRITTMDFMEMVNGPLEEDRDEEPLGMERPELNREVSVSDWLNDV